MDTAIREEDLRSIVESIWAAMLGIPIEYLGPDPGRGLEGEYSATIAISGNWEGALAVSCSEGLARFVGAALFQQDPWELEGDASMEAILELTNMIGGNVKALVGEGNRLGLPQTRTNDAEPLPGSEEARMLFDCLGEPLGLQVVRK